MSPAATRARRGGKGGRPRGRTIVALRLLHPALRRGWTDAALAAITGRRVVGVERRGKHQLLHLDDASILHVHFRMNGDWAVVRAGDAPRHARAVLDLDEEADGEVV